MLTAQEHRIPNLPASVLAGWSRLSMDAETGIFGTPEWVISMARTGFGHEDVSVLALNDSNGLLAGVLPLSRSRRGPLRETSFAACGNSRYSIADYCGLIARAGQEEAVSRAAVAWLSCSRRRDLLNLQELPESSATLALYTSMREARLPVALARSGVSFILRLPPSWEEYKRGLSSNVREALERKPRKLARDLGFEAEEVRGREAGDAFEAMREHQATRFGIGWSLADEARARRFYRSWLNVEMEHGEPHVLRLGRAAAPIAVLVGFRTVRTYYYLSLGMSEAPEYRAYSPGMVLLAAMLRSCIDRGIGTVDLLRGAHAYKRRLGGEPRNNYRIIGAVEPALSRFAGIALRRLAGVAGMATAGTEDVNRMLASRAAASTR